MPNYPRSGDDSSSETFMAHLTYIYIRAEFVQNRRVLLFFIFQIMKTWYVSKNSRGKNSALLTTLRALQPLCSRGCFFRREKLLLPFVPSFFFFYTYISGH